MNQRLLRPEEAAERLGVGRSKVFEWLGDGRLPSVKLDGSRRIAEADLAAFIARHRVDAGTEQASALATASAR